MPRHMKAWLISLTAYLLTTLPTLAEGHSWKLIANADTLIVAQPDKIDLWDTRTGYRKTEITRREKPDREGRNVYEEVALSGDGLMLATFFPDELTVYLRSLVSGQVLRELALPTTDFEHLVFGQGSQTLLAVSSRKQRIVAWDTKTGGVKFDRQFDRPPIRAALSSDGQYLAVNLATQLHSENGLRKVDRDEVRVFKASDGEFLYGYEPVHLGGLLPAAGSTFTMYSYDDNRLWTLNPAQESANAIQMEGRLWYYPASPEISPDGRYLLLQARDEKVYRYSLVQEKAGAPIEFKVPSQLGRIKQLAWSRDSEYYALADGSGVVEIWSVKTDRRVQLQGAPLGQLDRIGFTGDTCRVVTSGYDDGAVRLWDCATGREIVRLYDFDENGWLALTPQGYFASSGIAAESKLNVRVGGHAYPIGSFRERYYRPDIVASALGGTSIGGQALAQTRPAPAVNILTVPDKVASDRLSLPVEVVDQGGGAGDIRVFRNGTAIFSSAFGAASQGRQSLDIKLAPGKNVLSVVAFNADNSLSSAPAEFTVDATITSSRRPTLRALVVGVNEFRNPDFNLKYSVADASAIAQTLRQRGASLYDRVDVELLVTPAQTSRQALIEALTRYQHADAGDVFLLYVASHGVVVGDDLTDRQYYLVPSNVDKATTEAIARDAISQKELKRLLASIPAGRKVLLLDTCFAGALGEALVAGIETPTSSGGREDAREAGAMNVLANAVGSTVLSATTPQQVALEGYQSHGVFTYVLLDALSGKADTSKRGVVNTLDAARYVGSEVPKLAERVFRQSQSPGMYTAGQPFAIVGSQ